MNINKILTLGLEQHKKGNLDIAEKTYKKVLAIKPNNLIALKFLAEIYVESGRDDSAIVLFKKITTLDKDDVETNLTYAYALIAKKGHAKAELILQKIIGSGQHLGRAYGYLAQSLVSREAHTESIECANKALAIEDSNLCALYARAHSYTQLNMIVDAVQDFDRLIAISENTAEYYYGRGRCFFKTNNFINAARDFIFSVEKDPNNFYVHLYLGECLISLGMYKRAEESFYRALKIDPSHSHTMSLIVRCKHQSCNWDGYSADNEYLRKMILSGESIESPFSFLNLTSSAKEQLACNDLMVNHHFGINEVKVLFPVSTGKKIRVGYVSADYYYHATTVLINRLFMCHNREEFEIVGISLTTNNNDESTIQIKNSFDEYHEVANLTDVEAAKKIRSLNIDILVDLKGHTKDARVKIFSLFPAPIQVNYLGYPGTLGGKLMDYIIGDYNVIPEGYEQYYSEKVVRLQGSYQINDNQREISRDTTTRIDHGLPEVGFIFCSFNNSYKITPDVFSIWMRLLKNVPGSALWLLGDNNEAIENLKSEAELRGVDPMRIIFAGRVPHSIHLARHRHADLFLDTLPINAHTTTSDALWSGLPVLTCTGQAFAARVAASLLNAAGLPELVTHSHAEYEAMALELANSPGMLSNLKDRLNKNRLTCDLFNTEKTTRDLEAAYRIMHSRRQSGLPPNHINLQS